LCALLIKKHHHWEFKQYLENTRRILQNEEEKMKKNLLRLTILLRILSVLTFTFFPINTAFAATCNSSSCNWMDPSGTTCWNDAYDAVIHYASTMWNINKYSPGCIANFSYTRNTSSTWLAAETVGIYTYNGDQRYLYVWNNMWDGTGTICTKGHMGSSQTNYTVHTTSACA